MTFIHWRPIPAGTAFTPPMVKNGSGQGRRLATKSKPVHKENVKVKGTEEKLYKVAVVKLAENTGTAKAFVTVETRDGLVIQGISFHESADGHKWIFLPGQPKLDEAGNVLRDPINGKIQFYKILRFTDRDKWHQFQTWLLSELNVILPGLKEASKRPPEFRGHGGAL